MKKIICLILATLMAVIGVCCLAEGKDENEETAFLQIKEGVTAKVYRSAGDAEANDSLKSGSFCGLIEETTQGETPSGTHPQGRPDGTASRSHGKAPSPRLQEADGKP